jgi:hypothetical protein
MTHFKLYTKYHSILREVVDKTTVIKTLVKDVTDAIDLHDSIFIDTSVTQLSLVNNVVNNPPTDIHNPNILFSWTPCNVGCTIHVFADQGSGDIISTITSNNFLTWERVFAGKVIINHELIDNSTGKLLLPPTIDTEITTDVIFPGVQVNNNLAPTWNILNTIDPSSIDNTPDGVNYQHLAINDGITTWPSSKFYNIKRRGLQTLQNLTFNMFGETSKNNVAFIDSSKNIVHNNSEMTHTVLLRCISHFGDETSFNSNNQIDNSNFYGSDGIFTIYGSKMVLLEAFVDFDDAKIPNLEKLYKYKFRKNNTNTLLNLYVPVPSTSISIASQNYIGAIQIKDSIPNFKLSYDDKISFDDCLRDPFYDISRQRIYNVFTISLVGCDSSRTVFGESAIPSGIDQLYMFPVGFSMLILSSVYRNDYWVNNTGNINEYFVSNKLATDPAYANLRNNISSISTFNKYTDGTIVAYIFRTSDDSTDGVFIHALNGVASNDNTQITIGNQSDFVNSFGSGFSYYITNRTISRSLVAHPQDIDSKNSLSGTVTLENRWYTRHYPLQSVTDFTTRLDLSVMAPPPLYVWTLNGISFETEARLNSIQTQFVAFHTEFDYAKALMFESLARTEEGFRALSRNIKVVDNKYQVSIEDISRTLVSLNKRLNSVENYLIAQINAQKPGDWKEQLAKTTLGLALGALALYTTGNPATAGLVLTFSQNLTDRIFSAGHNFSNGDNNAGALDLVMATLMAGDFVLHSNDAFQNTGVAVKTLVELNPSATYGNTLFNPVDELVVHNAYSPAFLSNRMVNINSSGHVINNVNSSSVVYATDGISNSELVLKNILDIGQFGSTRSGLNVFTGITNSDVLSSAAKRAAFNQKLLDIQAQLTLL